MKNIIIFISILFVSSVSLATDSIESDLSGVDFQLISTGTPLVYIYGVSIAGCTNSTPVLLLGGPKENPIGKEIYSALLMAKASGKKVVLQSNQCWDEYSTPVITSMYLKD